ncbi:MAG: Uncharacterized protein G01um1014106_5 [Parcubacteria group bacterium Gr01-1014_106]|nr:MAG: Uncharacterized protein G01um1014106_5 [Parcubacteria group bacterium Gr01-1014_106]
MRFMPSSPLGRAVFVIVFATGVFLRLSGLDWGVPHRENQSSYYHDEGHQLALVEMDWKTFRTSFGYYELTRPVFFYRVVSRPLLAAGRALGLDDPNTRVFEIATLRSMNALVTIIGLLATYAVGRAVGGTGTGLWALAFLAVMPGHWYYAHVLKGDVLIATFYALALLIGFRMVERGDLRAYLFAGLLLGFGTSAKVSMLVAVPFFLFAHLLRALRERRLSFVVGRQVWIATFAAVLMFLLWYPYPFINFPRFVEESQEELWGPNAGFFSLRTDVRPAVYAEVWRSYQGLDRPFLDMIFGRFLRAAILPAAAVAAVCALIRWRRGDVRLLLVIAFAGLFYHSMTFIAPFDDRYVLPAAPFVAVLLATAAAGTLLPWLAASPALRTAGAALGALLLFGTAAITSVTFPAVGGEDPREAAIAWLAAEAPPGVLVAQPTLTGRWSLVIDRTRVTSMPIIFGEGNSRHVMRLTNPELVVVQREPWNYDHTFRYELEGVRGPFEQFLRSYDRVRTFGTEPQVLGGRLPRNMSLPVIDIYRYARTSGADVISRIVDAPMTISARGEIVQALPGTFSESALRGRTMRVTFDLSQLSDVWKKGSEPLRVGLLALPNGAPVPSTFRDLPGESTFLTKEGYIGWLTHLRPSDVPADATITLAIDTPAPQIWDVYESQGKRLQPRGSLRRDMQSARFAVAVLQSGPPAGTVRVTEAVLEQPHAP